MRHPLRAYYWRILGTLRARARNNEGMTKEEVKQAITLMEEGLEKALQIDNY